MLSSLKNIKRGKVHTITPRKYSQKRGERYQREVKLIDRKQTDNTMAKIKDK